MNPLTAACRAGLPCWPRKPEFGGAGGPAGITDQSHDRNGPEKGR